MAIIVQAPNQRILEETKHRLFLAGGVCGCALWQPYVTEQLKDILDLVVYNPRWDDYPVNDPAEAPRQIKWEYDRLTLSNIVSYWFSPETLCPIVLFELGMWGLSRPDRKVIIGIHPDYKRKEDVEIQTRLANPNIEIVYTLDDLAAKIREAIK